MSRLRAFVRDNRRLAALLLVLALGMKALLPAGFMLSQGSTVLTVEICADASGGKIMRDIVVPNASKPMAGSEHGKSAVPCPYAGLGMAGLAGADTALLALALAFILALGFAPARIPSPRRIAYLLPPLRGPPAFA